MLHYIVHIDETREVSLDELGDEPVILLQGLLSPGEHRIPGLPGYKCRVSITGQWLLATIKRENRQVAMFGIAHTQEAANQLWPRLEEFYFQLTEMPGIRSIDLPVSRLPAETPWCASVRMEITPDEVTWMDFFERCLAWAWVEQYRKVMMVNSFNVSHNVCAAATLSGMSREEEKPITEKSLLNVAYRTKRQATETWLSQYIIPSPRSAQPRPKHQATKTPTTVTVF